MQPNARNPGIWVSFLLKGDSLWDLCVTTKTDRYFKGMKGGGGGPCWEQALSGYNPWLSLGSWEAGQPF